VTVFYEVELIMNSRPLCNLFDDDFEEILTPNHMLYGRKLAITSNKENYENINESLSKRVKYLNELLEHFWNRWRYDYLLSLREYKSNIKSTSNTEPKVNDIVLIFNDKQPRQQWKMGRIIELLTSKDNRIRSAKVIIGKTRNIIDRPINRLYPIEYSNETNIEQSIDRRPRREAALIGELKRKFCN